MSWSAKEKTYETDLTVLQWVEELEQRVVLSDLQIRVHWGWHWVGSCLGEGFVFVCLTFCFDFCVVDVLLACMSV